MVAQNARLHTGGFRSPPSASMSTTKEPESELVTKKTTIRKIATTLRMVPAGRPSSSSNSAVSVGTAPSTIMPPSPNISR